MSDTCKWRGCDEPSRAKGFCENHYRELRRRAAGIQPKAAHDDVIYKVRIRRPGGTQPYYFSLAKQAWDKARRAAQDGTLEYFGEYHFDRTIEVDQDRVM